MRIVAISDSHTHQVDLPDGDLLIIGGDFTNSGTLSQVRLFNQYVEKQAPKFKHKPVVIAGNHDFLFQDHRKQAEETLSAATYVEDAGIEIDGVKIWGSPWTPRFYSWAFMLDRGRAIREYWEKIPEGLDVLITHGPPMGILDFCGQHVGCTDLLDVVTKERIRPPRFHVFGHIHEGYGMHVTDKTTFLNVSICDHRYQPVNAVTVFDV